MNKQISKLITQAGGHWNHGDFNMPSSVEFQAEDIEKFAELIVRECSQYIEDKFDFCGDEIIIAEAVLKHFGVEE